MTRKVFGLLILTILIQETLNWAFDKYFIVGIAPTLIFGIIWNFNNGQLIYTGLTDKRDFNFKKFKALSIWTIIWLTVYMIFLNIFLWPPRTDNQSLAKIIFMPVSALTAMLPIYALYYNIDFVTRGLTRRLNNNNLRLGTIFSLIFFPIGLFWIQPKIETIR
jgi:hypothetical protein